MKDTDFLTVRPIFHWTDQRIAVHIFYMCVGIQVMQPVGDVQNPKKIEAFIVGDDLAIKIEETYKLQEKYDS